MGIESGTLDNGGLTDITYAKDTTQEGDVQLVKIATSTDGSSALPPVDVTAGMKVDLGSDNDVTVTSGSITLAANSGVDIGDVDVTSLPALAAGTNAIGKLAANSGVDIGDVDVTSLPALATGTNIIGKVYLTDGTLTGDLIDSGTYAGPGVYLLDGGGDPATSSPQAVINSGTITGNTSAYTSGDSYHSSFGTLAALVSANGKTGHILNAVMYDEEGQGATLRVHLFRQPPSAQTVNDPITWTPAENAYAVGYIDFDTWVGEASGSQYAMGKFYGNRPIAFPTGGAVDDLSYIVEVRSATTWTGTTPLSFDVMVQPD